MDPLDRRGFLTMSARAGAAVAAMSAVSACGGSSGQGENASGGTVHWWEGGRPQFELNKKIVAENQDVFGDVKVTYYENTRLPSALQLAHQSKQMPDVAYLGSLALQLPLLVDEGWFQPLDLPGEAKQRLESMQLQNGLHVFGGKIYSFPLHGSSVNTINWYHRAALDQAGLDPDRPPTSYDELRDACRRVSKGDMAGLLLPLKSPTRIARQVDHLAQSAGFAGMDGQLFRTGEFAFHSDEYINAIEFLKALDQDGLMFPGNLTLDVKAGQARWASGASAFFFDGPWIPGNIKIDYPSLKGKVGGGPTLVPDKGHQVTAYVPAPGGSYYIPKEAKHPEVANKIMALLTTRDYQVSFSELMGHPPRDPAALDDADVEPVWRKVVKREYSTTFLAPDPVTGNIDVVDVEAEIKPVQPGAGEVVQGYFSGDVTDLRRQLKQVSDASMKALETAIKAARGQGAKVSLDDYRFPNWQPHTDYTNDMYAS